MTSQGVFAGDDNATDLQNMQRRLRGAERNAGNNRYKTAADDGGDGGNVGERARAGKQLPFRVTW